MKLELDDSKSFSIQNAFKAIDTNNKGEFTYGELDAFMQKNEVFLSNSEILSIFRRANKSQNGKLNLDEFKQNIFSDALPGKLYENDGKNQNQNS